MKILVTGATGFIGKHLTARLIKNDHTVFAVVRASTDTKELRRAKIKTYVFDDNVDKLMVFMNKEKFDGVIHLASLFLAAHKPEDIKGLVDSNVLFGANLLEASIQSNVSWFINTGTFWQHYQNNNYSPVNLYAATKQAFEDIARYYTETSTINFVTIKLNDTFGPLDVRPKVLNLLSKISQSGEGLDMSPGEQLIDISFIDNVIDGYIQLTKLLSQAGAKKLRGKSFAINSGEVRSLKELTKVFARATKSKLNINWGKREYRPREVMVPWNKGQSVPGWKPKISVEEGIKKTFKNEK